MFERLHQKLLAVVLMSLISAYQVTATNVIFPDQVSRSPDGRLTLTAISPENPRPFARDFVYTMSDSETGKTLWTRKQARDEPSPQRIFVHNSGWVIVCFFSHDLGTLDPKTGALRPLVSLREVLNLSAENRHARWTTAGILWQDFSLWYFIEHDNRLLFVIRPCWAQRFVYDVHKGLPTEAAPEIIAACERHENQFAMDTLRRGIEHKHVLIANENDPLGRDVRTAMIIAAQNRLPQSIPLLREFETLETSRVRENSIDLDQTPWPHESLGWHAQAKHTFRIPAQFALRILGETPNPLPGSWIYSRSPEGEGFRVLTPELPEPRGKRVDQVQIGDTIADLLRKIGPPDTMNYYRTRAWEYHIDDADPYTLSLTFVDRCTRGIVVTEIDIIRPPIWQQDSLWVERMRR